MIRTRELIIQLKAVKEERNLSLNDILNIIEQNGDILSKTSLSRLFQEGSEELSFKEETLLPVARAILDISNIEETDNTDEAAMKTLLQFKGARIRELEHQVEQLQAQLDHEKVHSNEKFDEEREKHQRSIDFLKSQIELKDRRYDGLLAAVKEKDARYEEVLSLILSCPCRASKEKG